MSRCLLSLLVASVMLVSSPARAAMELLMLEQPGCMYCARWDAEVAPIYPKTSEGRAAPLRRLHLHAALPPGIAINRPPAFTPTFVLIVDGVETDRIEGYPGEDFFWALLAGMITKAGGRPDDADR